MTARAKKRAYFIGGIIISVVLIWLLFREVRFAELANALKNANYWWLLPNVAFIVLTMYQRAYRWRFMLLPIGNVPFPKLLAATCIGFMANNVLPFRLGEFVRAYSLSSQYPLVTKSASLATIFVERMVFDLVALLAIFGGVIAWSHLEFDENMQNGLILAVTAALLGLAFIVVVAAKADRFGVFASRRLLFLPDRLRELIESIVLKFARGLEFLAHARSVVWVGAQTLLIWILMGLSNVFVFKAFGLGLPLDASYVVLVVVSISILVPSSPGFVGVYHAGAVWSLMAYGVEKETALSCALVLHAAQYIVVTLMGFYFLRKEHLSLKQLGEQADQELPPEGDDNKQPSD